MSRPVGGHARRPAFPFTFRAPSDQLVCDARSYVRAYRADGRALHAPMLAWTVGPLAIGETGDNSLESLISGRWLVQVCPDGSWVLYQEEGGLLTVTPWDDPPAHAGPDARHPTATFDQAARAILAWEEADTILVRRWDPVAGEYIENVSFSGHDPCLAFDATWGYHVPSSDVLLFYLSSDRERLMCRVQREVYAVEHELYDHGAPLVLDRVLRLPLQYMVLLSDEHGSPLVDESGDRIVLLSDLYPFAADDEAVAEPTTPEAWLHTVVLSTIAANEAVATTFDLVQPAWLHEALLHIYTADLEEVDVVPASPQPSWLHEALLLLHVPDPEEVDAAPTSTQPPWPHEWTLSTVESDDAVDAAPVSVQPAWVHKEA